VRPGVPPAEPSPFFSAHREALCRAAARAPVLDVACGRGRHALAAARLGLRTVGIDRNPDALRELMQAARSERLRAGAVRADLESGAGIPLAAAGFGAVLVFRYLWRPLAPAIEALLRPGGILLYETFTRRQKDLPHGPGNEEFLLREGELPKLFPELRVEAFEESERRDADGRVWHLASLLARKP
jgi:SAM-dependent methyltransferase